MKFIRAFALVFTFCLGTLLSSHQVNAAEVKTELNSLVEDIRKKLSQGKKSEADLEQELKRFDVIVANHKGEKTDDVAQVLVMKAQLYVEVIEDFDKAKAIMVALQKDFEGTEPAKRAPGFLEMIDTRIEAHKIKKHLVAGAAFPEFDEKDLDGKSLSIARFKGKVVLVDFWATWCGPCIAELPNVKKAYTDYKAKGFEILGISLDKEKDALTSFIAKNEMPWPQFFDGKGWQNTLAAKYAIQSIPATYLLDKEGKIIAKDLRGEALSQELAKLLK